MTIYIIVDILQGRNISVWSSAERAETEIRQMVSELPRGQAQKDLDDSLDIEEAEVDPE